MPEQSEETVWEGNRGGDFECTAEECVDVKRWRALGQHVQKDVREVEGAGDMASLGQTDCDHNP
jgi:hypothetical protein